ncbi:MAG TPA: hypothetical protein VIF62_27345 [Labilithrix sp.]|jgi:hypothetical protein
MKTDKKNGASLTEHREILERKANVVRSRLLRTIDALDTRRHQVKEISEHMKRIAVPATAIVAGIAAITAIGAFTVVKLVRSRRERHLSYRFGEWLSARTAPKRPSILEDAVRKVVVSVLGIVATEAAKRVAKNVLDARMPQETRLLPAGGAP